MTVTSDTDPSSLEKVIHIYFQGISQGIVLYPGTAEEELLKLIKRIFKIEEPFEELFLQNGEGYIAAFSDKIPNGIKLNLLVRTSALPKPLMTNDPSLLPGFKWISRSFSNEEVSEDGRRYRPVSNSKLSSGVRSDQVYTHGKLYFVIRTDMTTVYVSFGYDSNISNQKLPPCYGSPSLFSFSDLNPVLRTFGILLDMDSRKMMAFKVNDKYKPTKLINTLSSLPKSVRIYGWIKTAGFCGSEGITIIEPSLPIPFEYR